MLEKERSIVKDIVDGKCAKCRKGDMFKNKGNVFVLRVASMNKQCPNCNHYFEQEPGYFLGAMYVSYALSVAEAFAVYLVIFSFISDIKILIGFIAGTVLLMSLFNYRYSRIVWSYMFK